MTTKLYPRGVRRLVYALVAVLTIGQPLLALAQTTDEPPVIPADAIHFPVGYSTTLILSSGAKLGVFPGAITTESDVVWKVAETPLPTAPSGMTLVGSMYRLQILGTTALGQVSRPLAIALPYTAPRSLWDRGVWQYDTTTSAWKQLTASASGDKKLLTASPKILDGYFAVFENRKLQIGVGSWYCKNHCSARYPKYHGTSNDVPVGSLVKVTNIANKRAVIVKIISKWGQPAGRVVDLSYAAFAVLKSTNGGLERVTVQPAAAGAKMGPVGGSSTTPTPASSTEVLPQLTMTSDSVGEPSVQASGYMVYEQNTGKVLASKNADVARPIASITKLMTGMVVLDRKPDLNRVMAYSSKDNAECSCLRVGPGETMRLSDVINVMYVGSANNMARMLARSTGLTMPQFVTAMNAKAKAIGLTKTKFIEPSGLDARNMSTPAELAKLAAYAFHNYPTIRTLTTKKSYSFTTLNTKKPHTILLRYSLVGSSSLRSMTVTGTKTGFTYEAGETYAFRAKNAQGVHVIVTILNSPSVTRRNADVAALLQWAFTHHSWS